MRDGVVVGASDCCSFLVVKNNWVTNDGLGVMLWIPTRR